MAEIQVIIYDTKMAAVYNQGGINYIFDKY
jgi:hypothetical protein